MPADYRRETTYDRGRESRKNPPIIADDACPFIEGDRVLIRYHGQSVEMGECDGPDLVHPSLMRVRLISRDTPIFVAVNLSRRGQNVLRSIAPEWMVREVDGAW